MSVAGPKLFKRVGERELACLYRALCSYVAAPRSSVWFHAADKSDPCYLEASRAAPGAPAGPERPELNTLFQMGHQARLEILSRLNGGGPGAAGAGGALAHWVPPELLRVFETWSSFCRVVTASAKSSPGSASSLFHDLPPSTT